MVNALLLSFGVIFVAELGDKSQIIAGLAFFGFAVWTPARRHAQQRRGGAGQSVGALGRRGRFGRVLPCGAGRQDHARHHHVGDQRGAGGDLGGSTLGMVAADALAIGVGQLLGKRLPDKLIRWGAAGSFVLFGALLVLQGLGLIG